MKRIFILVAVIFCGAALFLTYARKESPSAAKNNGFQTTTTADSVEIRSGNNRIVVYPNGSIRIYSTSPMSGLTLDAGTQALTLKGTNVNIESATGVTIKGTTTTNILGSVIKLNGGSTPVAKLGSLVTVPVGGGNCPIVGNTSTTVFIQ
jgi:hypothetical protein